MQIYPIRFSAIRKEAVKPGVTFRYNATGDLFTPSQSLDEAEKVKLERRVGAACIEPDDQALYKVLGTRIHGPLTTPGCKSEFWFKKTHDDQGREIWVDTGYTEVSPPTKPVNAMPTDIPDTAKP